MRLVLGGQKAVSHGCWVSDVFLGEREAYLWVVLICQWFAPTKVLITLEGDNIKDEDFIVKDEVGNVVGLKLPEKLVIMANHQVSCAF